MNELKKKLSIKCTSRHIWTFLCCLLTVSLSSQNVQSPRNLNILFYNTENLFDTLDDPETQDDEFLPQAKRRWTDTRLKLKLDHIAQVIIVSCGYEAPAIVGVCEVENRLVLESLVRDTPLEKLGYGIIHKDSPDERGIDVAMLYRKKDIEPLEYHYYPLRDDQGKILKTREILYVTVRVKSGDTLHLFFNHWPSRYGGQAETEPLRVLAGRTLSKLTAPLLKEPGRTFIVIMGDFNDQPQNRSIREGLGAKSTDNPEVTGELVNLSVLWTPEGTLKFRQSWQIFDQVIVSDYLLKGDKLHVDPEDAQIVSPDFLFEPDPKFKGKRLFRTYYGYKFQGGFSDHFPVRLLITY